MDVASLVMGLYNWLSLACWYFACWYKLRKVKSWFNDFWVGLFKDGRGLLVHEKCAVSYKWIYELSQLFECWWWCNSFWLGWYSTHCLWNAGGPLQFYFLSTNKSDLHLLHNLMWLRWFNILVNDLSVFKFD